jgi:hypothetical protein
LSKEVVEYILLCGIIYPKENIMRKITVTADNPLDGDKCPGCGEVFKLGDEVTLIPIGPGPSKEQQQRCREGMPYNAIALPIHWDCAGGVEDPTDDET